MQTLQSLNPTLRPIYASKTHPLSFINSNLFTPAIRFNFKPLTPTRRSTLPRSSKLKIKALDAAQPYDLEAQINEKFEKSTKLKIAIIGFGNFGQFLAKTLVRQGHTVIAHSRSDYYRIASQLGVSFFIDPDDLCEEHPEVILLCTSILSTKSVLESLPVQRLKRSTLFVDVLSVKEFPRKLFLEILPVEFDVLCTHPMFGPESGKNSWANLPFVYERVRIGKDESRVNRCDRFLKIFENEGCRMVDMSCSEHDLYAAASQFITHTVGRMLGGLELQSTPINTKGYETLLDLVDNTSGDSFDLYYGLFMYNVNATEQLERLEMAFDKLKKQLFTNLHDILRKQIFENDGGLVDGLPGRATNLALPENVPPALPENGRPREEEATSHI